MPRFPLAGSAIAAGLVLAAMPLLGTSGAAGCPSWVDGTGDATTAQVPDPSGAAIYDENMDIVSASLTTTADTLVAVVGVKKLNPSASDLGDEYNIEFTVGGQTIDLYADRDMNIDGQVPGPSGPSAGFYNVDSGKSFGTAVTKYDTKANTVTITGKVSDLKTAVGAEVAGKAITGLQAQTWDALAPFGAALPYDDASAPNGTTLTVGTPCGSGGGGGPTPTPTPTLPPVTNGGDNGPDVPGTGCYHFTDPKADAAGTIEGPVGFSNDPTLDVVSGTFKGDDAALTAYVTVDKLSSTSANGSGPRWEVAFTAGGKAIVLYHQVPDSTWTQIAGVRKNAQTVNPNTGGTVGGTYNASLKVTAALDAAHNLLRLSVTRASLEAITGALDGVTLTGVQITTKTLTATGGVVTHDTAPTTATTWTFGDNRCFGPASGKLANAGKTTVQYGDAAAVAAKLTNADGHAVAGRRVTFAIGSVTATATTGADGVARSSLKPTGTAGAYTLNVSFPGDATAGKVSLGVPFTITVEATRLTLTVVKNGAKRTVTAKLLDDDGHPVVGQTIAWTINGKPAGTGKTSSAGTAVLATAKPTQTVAATFTAVAGKYAGSKATLKV